MPNNFTAYDTYQRLRGPKRPVSNLLRKGDLKRTLKPTTYLTETRTFYKFGATVESNGAKFLYLVHKGGYEPDPLATEPPPDRVKDGYFLSAFPQFRGSNQHNKA